MSSPRLVAQSNSCRRPNLTPLLAPVSIIIIIIWQRQHLRAARESAFLVEHIAPDVHSMMLVGNDFFP